MSIPKDLRYTASHEWVRREADGSVAIGITDHAQAALGDLVYLELPAVGRRLRGQGELCGGRVGKGGLRRLRARRGRGRCVNDALTATTEDVNQDAMPRGSSN
jgi:glycine cleavage system H protein